MSLLLYYGEDAFSRQKAEEKFIENTIPEEWKAFNLAVLENATGEAIAAAVLTAPFGPGPRLVVVKDYPGFSSKGDEEALMGLKVPEDTHLLFSGPSTIDKRLAFTKWVLANGKATEYANPKPWETDVLTDWIQGEVRRRNGSIDRPAAEMLAEMCGGNRWSATQEIEKILTYSAGITVKEVKVLGCGEKSDVFMLTQAIAERNLTQAIPLLERLLVTDKGIRILATIATTVRNWLMVKMISQTQRSAEAIAQALALKSTFRVKKDLEVCRNWSQPALEKAVQIILEADLAMKQSSMPDKLVLERMLAKLVCLK